MPAAPKPFAGSRIALRCDGNARVGAGHVARCVPLATAFAELGCEVSFIGRYEGLAEWLLTRAGMEMRAPDVEAACGVALEHHDAAVLDSYTLGGEAICALALALPIATLAESDRCPTRGIVLDYHLDRGEPPGPRLLAGPSFAPLDHRFAGAGRPAAEIRRVLVTVGGSAAAQQLLAQIAQITAEAFADAEIVLAGTALAPPALLSCTRVTSLPRPSALVDRVSDIDLAVTAAGLSAYELACAGVPLVAIVIAANQRRVASGLARNGAALSLDLTSGDTLVQLPGVLERMRDARLRERLATRGMELFDGQGARRAARALAERFAATRP
jgi:spore coat polysaccharide biosynthesis predicted glycosyltransferase SpsG